MGAKKKVIAVGTCTDCGSKEEYRQYQSGPKLGQLYRWCVGCGCDQRGGVMQQRWAERVHELQESDAGPPTQSQEEKPEPEKKPEKTEKPTNHSVLSWWFN